MKPKANLRLLMLFLTLAGIVLSYDQLPKITAAASKLAVLPNVLSQPGSVISEAMVPPLIAITVTNTNDSGSGSLRAAIAAAQNGDTVDASGITGTITLLSELAVIKSITITGPAAGTLTVSGNDLVRVFNITAPAGGTVVLSHLTISDGFSTGGTITNGGGGIRVEGAGGLTLDHCIISNNSDANTGGAGGIGNNSGATLTLTNCTLSGNTATGAAGTCGIRARNTIILTNCTISDNTSTTSSLISGGITNDDTMTLTNCTFTGNSGPAMYNRATLTLDGCTFTGNNASKWGGAIYNDGVMMELNNCTLSNNTASQGGAIFSPTSATLTNCILDGNSVSGPDGGGGAIYSYARFSLDSTTSVVLTNCTLSNNQDNGTNRLEGGGAIFVRGLDDGTYSFTNCTFTNNYSFFNGGAMRVFADATITNCTFSGNRVSDFFQIGFAASFGAAIDSGNRKLTITNSTFTGNSGGLGNAHTIIVSFGSLILTNSIVAGNPDGDILLDMNTLDNPATSLKFNLIGDGEGSGLMSSINGNIVGTEAAPINPLLASLGSYGGNTQALALLPGSPAINAGTASGAPTTDQRGIARPQQATVDIGAFESRGFSLAVASGNNQSTAANTAFTNPLSVTVTSTNSEPVNGGQVTFAPPVSGARCTVAGNPATISSGVATSGTVTANGNSGSYTVSAMTNGAIPINFSLTNTVVCQTITVTNPATTTGTVGTLFSQTFTQAGGIAPLNFTVNSGILPSGLTLATNGTLSGTPTQAGSFPITVRATDTNNCFGNGATYTLLIYAPPGITCPTNIMKSADSGVCTATVAYTTPTATGGCPGTVNVTCTPASGTTFPKGTTTVTCTATDACSNTGSCNFTVTVVDSQFPTLSACPTNQNVGTASGCVNVTYTPPTVSDNCSGAMVSCAPPSGTCFPIGNTTVTCIGADTSSNTTTCSFTVTVSPCTITCPANVTAPVASSQCQAVINYSTPTTTSSCGTVICSPPSGSTFPKGTTTVTCSTQTGPSCSFTVTVNDTQMPQITCPANVSQATAKGLCQAVVNYTNATATDNCSGVGTPVCNPASGSVFPKGITTVTCTVSDASGNTGSCSFTVTVTDSEAPTIVCPTNISVPATAGQCAAVVSYATPQVSDNCPNVGAVVCSPTSGTSFAKGVTTVTCTVADASGNTKSCSFTVTVNDTTPPQITCPVNIVRPTEVGQCAAFVTYTLTATDNCSGVTVVCNPPSGSNFPKGITTVSCVATDTAKNSVSCTFTVTVNDTTPPQIVCPPNQTQVAATPGSTTLVVTYPVPTVSDNCSGATIACVPPSGSAFPLGTTTVTCTATDGAGNTTSCRFTVTVYDIGLQDESNSATVVLVNSTTGQYHFCYSSTVFTGTGSVTRQGSTYIVTHNATDRRVTIRVNGGGSPPSGTALLQSPPGATSCTITDRDMRNNSCQCP
jgi:hypothetical protein